MFEIQFELSLSRWDHQDTSAQGFEWCVLHEMIHLQAFEQEFHRTLITDPLYPLGIPTLSRGKEPNFDLLGEYGNAVTVLERTRYYRKYPNCVSTHPVEFVAQCLVVANELWVWGEVTKSLGLRTKGPEQIAELLMGIKDSRQG